MDAKLRLRWNAALIELQVDESTLARECVKVGFRRAVTRLKKQKAETDAMIPLIERDREQSSGSFLNSVKSIGEKT